MKNYKITLLGTSEAMTTAADLYKQDGNYHLFYQKDGEFGKFLPARIVRKVEEIDFPTSETFIPVAIDPR